MTDIASHSATMDRFSTVPLRWTNLGIALAIAVRSFRSEAFVIAICYLWYLVSLLGFRLDRLVLRRQVFEVRPAECTIVECEIITSLLYGRDVCWLRLSDTEGVEPAGLIATLKAKTAAYRLAVFRLDPSDTLPERWPELQSCGVFAGFAIYTLREIGDCRERGFAMAHVSKDRAKDGVSADFFLVERDGKAIGLTGTYSVDFWPGIAWGGWGALIRSAGFRDAGLETVRITENLAQARKAAMFCIETSDGAKYRTARRIYEIYGLELLLEIPDFYSDGEAYLVFGKALSYPKSAAHG